MIYTSNRGLLCSRVWVERPIHRRLVCRTAVCFGPPCGRSFSTVLAVGQHPGFYFKLLHQQPGAFLHLPLYMISGSKIFLLVPSQTPFPPPPLQAKTWAVALSSCSFLSSFFSPLLRPVAGACIKPRLPTSPPSPLYLVYCSATNCVSLLQCSES